MKKLILKSIISSIAIGTIVWAASILMSFSFIEWSFFIGMGLSVVLFFLNSSGGSLSKGATFNASMMSRKIQKNTEMKTTLGPVFYGSVLFTIISFIMMIITYF